MNPWNIVFAVSLVVGGGLILASHADEQRIRGYIDDCDRAGGRVVKMYTQRGYDHWIQCVKGLEVVTLPQDR